MTKTREEIITSMCFTSRHDYGLEPDDSPISQGMSADERLALWNHMAQLFDNNIAPYMDFKHE